MDPLLADPTLLAVPFFVLFIGLELLALRFLDRDDEPMGYTLQDSGASLAMGLGSAVVNLGVRAAALVGYTALYAVSPLRLDPHRWWTWVLTLLLVDLPWYTYHRCSHRVRLLWAMHQAHHSSVHFNYTTALRQKWNPWGELLFWVWRPVELVLNTPSHHRVHHASDAQYLDHNYGGILIVWDRLFGTFKEERDRPTYGLTHPVTTFNPFRLQYAELGLMLRQVRGARRWRDRLGFVLAPPGWSPET